MLSIYQLKQYQKIIKFHVNVLVASAHTDCYGLGKLALHTIGGLFI